MKFSKNILILLGSYLGILMLICCTAQFMTPLSSARSETDDGTLANGTSGAENGEDIPVAALPEEEESDAEMLNGSLGSQNAEDTDSLDVFLSEEESAEDVVIPIYCLRTVKADGATAAIGVYDEDGTLLRMLDTPLYALPASDRAMLDIGIEVSGDEDLDALIEDFGG